MATQQQQIMSILIILLFAGIVYALFQNSRSGAASARISADSIATAGPVPAY
jgi:hypothetical protein